MESYVVHVCGGCFKTWRRAAELGVDSECHFCHCKIIAYRQESKEEEMEEAMLENYRRI